MSHQVPSAQPESFTGLGRETYRQADPPGQKFYGLVELDADGTVLYSRVETDGRGMAADRARDVTGRNFYTEVAPFRNVDEFRRLLECFCKGSQPASSADFVCDYDDGPQAVRVLLARIRERTELDVTKSVLVHIRKAQ
jgi:hypothetical protein